MKRFAWLTDIHLEFLTPWELDKFLDRLQTERLDALLLTGDIAQAPMLRSVLLQMAQQLNIPIYFVLGNHDYYHGSIPKVRTAMTTLTLEKRGLYWLPATGVVELTTDVGLVGHDGWADGRYGQFLLSPVMLNDYVLIESLRTPSAEERLKMLNALGDEAADHLRVVLPKAAQQYRQVLVLVHPPPFSAACWHNGKIPGEDDIFLPHFGCQAVGAVLLEIAALFPQVEFTVLCGHTHGGGRAQITANLLALTGAAEYGAPVIQQIFALAG